MRGESSFNPFDIDNTIRYSVALIKISVICLVISIAWVLTSFVFGNPPFSYIFMLPVWIIGVVSFIIVIVTRQIDYHRDVKNIESVNDPKRGINDEQFYW